MRGNDKLVIPGPVLWRHRPIEFSNLDYSRTNWEGGKVVADVLCENRGYHMWDIGGEYVPAQRAQGEAGREMSKRGRVRAGTHAVRPIPLPSSMARGRRCLDANFGCVSARYMARHWPPSQSAVPLETPSASCVKRNVQALNGQRRTGMCFVRWAGWDDVMFKWGFVWITGRCPCQPLCSLVVSARNVVLLSQSPLSAPRRPRVHQRPPGQVSAPMKAFFHRLHIGSGAKDKDREPPTVPKEKFPPLPSWPPQSDSPRPTSTSTIPASFKPLPELVPSQLSSQLSRPLPAIQSSPSPSQGDANSVQSVPTPKAAAVPLQAEESSQESSTNTSESITRNPRKMNGAGNGPNINTALDVQKKVAFLSPPQTPVDFDRALPSAPAGTASSPPNVVPLKTTASRFQAVYGKEPRTSISMGASSSKTDVGGNYPTTSKATSTRTGSPYLQKSFDGPSAQSLRSGTPYSQMSNNTSGSRILSAQSWSEVTEDDLVSNIGSRERTRQEVLFEIISSEERWDINLYMRP